MKDLATFLQMTCTLHFAVCESTVRIKTKAKHIGLIEINVAVHYYECINLWLTFEKILGQRNLGF